MVKVNRNNRVWEVPAKKERKKRTKRIKQQVLDQANQSNSADQKEQVEIKIQQSPIDEDIKQKQRSISQQSEENKEQDEEIIDQFEEFREKSNKEVNQQQKKQSIQVKDILLSDLQFQQGQPTGPNQNFCHRFDQESTVLNFLLGQSSRTQPDWLYIYGPPGVGKTYLIKNLLKRQQLLQQTVWLNCYSILQKSKFKRSKGQQSQQKDKKIVIIDEFDQLQSLILTKKFKLQFLQFILELNSEILTEDVSQIRYILISNKSYHSLIGKALESVKQIMKCERIIQRPFMPYTLKSVQAIIKKKIQQIELVMPHLKFNYKLLQIAVNKMYNSSQDIRSVIAFIVDNYQKLLMVQDNSNLSQKDLKLNFINEMMRRKDEMKQEQNMVCNYLKGLHQNQKHLLRQIILQYEQASKKDQEYRIEFVYRQGRKKKIQQNTVDVWLQEWSQMGIVSKKRIYPRFQHYLFPIYVVQTSLTMKQYKPYFY